VIPWDTPRLSSESNGVAEAFFESVTQGDVSQAGTETSAVVGRRVPQGIEHDNQQAPYRA
jgi:hypothetical protein